VAGDVAGEPERDDWLARQRVVELGAVFFKRVRGRAPRRGEGVGSDGLVPQWIEFRRVARFVNPGCPIDDDSRRVHGIGDEKVAGQPTFAERAADLARVLSAWPTVVTYNGSRFDLPVLLREFARAKVAPPRTLLHSHLDLADLAARRYPGRPTRPASNKLGDQCAYWGVPLVGAHRADADAAATGAMLVKMVQDGAEL
jgi:DNA polymerase III epsilon subunit-like protein